MLSLFRANTASLLGRAVLVLAKLGTSRGTIHSSSLAPTKKHVSAAPLTSLQLVSEILISRNR